MSKPHTPTVVFAADYVDALHPESAQKEALKGPADEGETTAGSRAPSELELSDAELFRAVQREPLVLGASLDKSLRPNLELWREVLPSDFDLKSTVLTRGLRFLTCSCGKKTRPRLEAARALGVPAHELLTKMRYTDAQFDKWLRGACELT